MRGFTTRALHVPKAKRDVHGALRTPVYDNAAFEFENSDEIAQVSLGRALGHVYSRSSNPTVEDLEQRLKNLTGALGVLALGSGMAAISTAILTLARAGIVWSPPIVSLGTPSRSFKRHCLALESRFVLWM